MPVIKVIEVMTESPESWEHATQLAVDHAKSSVRNIRSAYIKEFSAVVSDDKITMYRVNAKISFEVE
jgi:flavin-binding protein dodecin